MQEIFLAVTPDGTVDDVSKVKVRKTIELDQTSINDIQKLMPEWKVPEPEMHRLELIDADIAKLEDEKTALDNKITLLNDLRGKVGIEAEKVC